MLPAIIPLLSSIASITPGIVRLFSGDRAAVVTESVLDAFAVATGVTDPEEQKRVLETNQEARNALAIELRRIELEETALANADRADARKREVDTGDHLTPRLLALSYTLALCGVMWTILSWVNITPEQKELANLIVGFLFAKIGTILDYYFGASAKNGH